MVVTDPAVQPLIPDEKLGRLAKLEAVYLKAADALSQSGIDNTEFISSIVSCADGVLEILAGLEIEDGHDRKIAAIRISLKTNYGKSSR